MQDCPSGTVHVCILSDKGARNSSKLRIICWAQVLGNQMCCARAGLEAGRQQLVLRCRPAATTLDTDCLAPLNGESEASNDHDGHHKN
jgi:hypothetical protein